MIHDDGSLWLLAFLPPLAIAALVIAVIIDSRRHGPAKLQDPTDSMWWTFFGKTPSDR